MANEGSGTRTSVFEWVTLTSPPGNERGEVWGDEWSSEEDGEEDMHCEDAGMCGELGDNTHPRRAFIGSMGGLA